MTFMMEKILINAQKLSSRLREHDGSTDHLVELMTALNKKIDSMKTFQDNLPDLAEMALCKPRSTVKLGLSQENGQIRELEQENKELKQSLEEHELALELIMSKYRHQVTRLLKTKQMNESVHHKETVQSQDLQDKMERIDEMGKMMWKAVADDDDGQSAYNSQQLLTQLRLENNGMRELISIACNSGNPLKATNQHTQTDDAACSQHGNPCLFYESGRGQGAEVRPKLSSSYSEIFCGANNGSSLVSTGVFINSKAAADEPSIGLTSQRPRVRVTSGDDRISLSETRAAPTMSLCGKERGIVLPDVVTSRSYSAKPNEERRTSNLDGSSSPDAARARIDSRSSENQILNHSNFHNCQTDVDSPAVTPNAFAATSNSDANHALKALPPKHPSSNAVCMTETTIHQQDLIGHENPATDDSPPASSLPPDDGLDRENATTSSVERTASKLERVTVAAGDLHSKTPPGKSSAIKDGASVTTGAERSPSFAPSIHGGKTAATLHAATATVATPVRINATAKKHPSVFSVVAAAADSCPQTGAAPSPTSTIGAISSALLDSNGNDSHSSVPN